MYEDDPYALLATLAERDILIEINLTSNDVILGVEGKNHPLPVYMAAGVPFVDAFRTMCIAPDQAFQHLLGELEELQRAA